ncbi:MAG: hypothetical protein EHM58_13230 [Ignavibacteriae bacterium]|nr:MAG: hypothetical protein EHM58_13230 [Ignavibacteriota bacterium]
MDKLVHDTFYHIYNRGNNKENIYYKDSNYIFFLQSLDSYLFPYLDLYSYCLLPNHFHLLIKTKSEETILKNGKINLKNVSFDEYGEIIGEIFRRFFMSYSKAINRQENRSGSLFKKLYQRKPINSDNYLIRTILYIHLNPVHHKLTEDFETYRWSSYNKMLNQVKSKLRKNEVLDMFYGIENYIKLHKEERDLMVLRNEEL